jgi:hypothetical protein
MRSNQYLRFHTRPQPSKALFSKSLQNDNPADICKVFLYNSLTIILKSGIFNEIIRFSRTGGADLDYIRKKNLPKIDKYLEKLTISKGV